MFTGIVEHSGTVVATGEAAGERWIQVDAAHIAQGARVSESIAVQGVCLTITCVQASLLRFGLAPETLQRTNLGELCVGAGVHLERALSATGRFGGHFVQGHVDDTVCLAQREQVGSSIELQLRTSPAWLRYIVPKGYVALDGVSLTVIALDAESFRIMLIRHTQHTTLLDRLPLGARVNLEVDLLAKYAERFHTPTKP